MEELYRHWGHTIRTWRREVLGCTQAELAARLGVTQASVCRWESGENAPRDDMRVQLAEVFGADVRVIFPMMRPPKMRHVS